MAVKMELAEFLMTTQYARVTSTVEHTKWWLLQSQLNLVDRRILGILDHPQVDRAFVIRAFANACSGQWQSDVVYNVDLIDTA
jgi:hypothetical protein